MVLVYLTSPDIYVSDNSDDDGTPLRCSTESTVEAHIHRIRLWSESNRYDFYFRFISLKHKWV